jgi:hypothetical protein
MKQSSKERLSRYSDAGATLFIVAAGMVMLLGVSALAIDLVSFYVGRNEAQRAADASALAGASIFVSQGCTTATGGCVPGGPQEAPAKQRAIDVAAQNLVAGKPPTAGATCNFTKPEDPQITVTVAQVMPTFFAKIFGFTTVNVSASATAEAFNPSGGNVPVGTSCLRPFLVPNCDSGHPISNLSPDFGTKANTNCGGTGPDANGNPTGSTIACPSGVSGTCYPSYFFEPNTQYDGKIVNPGVYDPKNPTTSGAIGEPWQLHSDAAPSQWYLLALGGTPSGAQLRDYIRTCAPQVIACNRPLNTASGKKVGPTDQGTNDLIHASSDGRNKGQDKICAPTTTPACSTPPFPITGGANNPNPSLVGKTFYSPSDSIASVAVYAGQQLTPGKDQVEVLGYMQLFIQDANHQNNADLIDTIILNIGGCGATSGAAGGPITSQGGSPIPIRLIRPAGQ